ncbi:hypothetical protein [Bartonella sp. DGB2]|uniref:hypothetical protein n=1 Tax=Bartonella sp. DGB2 TaxID=3388426 RepID=UPI00398FD64A
MFKWVYKEQVPTKATCEQIWSMWQDVASWPCWDHELEWVKLNGNFAAGTTGRMKPIKGPEINFTISEATPLRSFSDVARLPLTTLVFNHEYFSPPETEMTAYIQHSVTMTGWLALVFGFLIGRQIKKSLKNSMVTLSKQAETLNR